MARARLTPRKRDVYGLSDARTAFSPSGCTLLDCALGGGWAMNRILNLVGDKSTGKTLLALEALANFGRAHEGSRLFYCELEAAFDEHYARTLQFPLERLTREGFGDGAKRKIESLEELLNRLEELIAEQGSKPKVPALYVIDSLDALAHAQELKKDIGDDGWNTRKALLLSEFFRKRNRAISSARVTLMFVSQVRDNIGVFFGEKHKRNGGKALDFYATHVVWLATGQAIDRQRRGVTRSVGILTSAKVKKNKVALPYRTVKFPLYFGFGIEDLEANVWFLLETKAWGEVGLKSAADLEAVGKSAWHMTDEDYARWREVTAQAARKVWAEVEAEFAPVRKKYTAPGSAPSPEALSGLTPEPPEV